MTETDKYELLMKNAINKINKLNKRIKVLEDTVDVAVIGYNCRFPAGANTAQEFWELLVQGRDGIREIPRGRFDYKIYYHNEKGKVGKSYVKDAAFLDGDIKTFDNFHFDMNEMEASSLDPQHRLLLEVTWEAIANAGLNYQELKGTNTGVFVGIDAYEYSMSELVSEDFRKITPYSLMGNSAHSAAGRLAYYFDFKGPAIAYDSGCSSSLTALNGAVAAIKSGQCNIAIVAGVNLLLSPNIFIALSQLEALSPTGKSKPFDISADGFGRGEGCGVIVLRRLDEALDNNDNIEAVVKSVCIEHDGRSNGFYAPNGESERRIIEHAIEASGLQPDDIDYIETHGTGTVIGDAIEAQALCRAFEKKKQKLKIGSVKSNIGHLEAAAGIASIIKVLLSFRFNKLPKMLHYKKPNSEINLKRLEIVDKLVTWKRQDKKRAVGISSFGISGTLAHTILQDSEGKKEDSKGVGEGIVTLSAQTREQLEAYLKTFKDWVATTEFSLDKIIIASNITRSHFVWRYSDYVSNKEELLNNLDLSELHKYIVEIDDNEMNARNNDMVHFNIKKVHAYNLQQVRVLYEYTSVFSEYMTNILAEIMASNQTIEEELDLYIQERESLEQGPLFKFIIACSFVHLIVQITGEKKLMSDNPFGNLVVRFYNNKINIDEVITVLKEMKNKNDEDNSIEAVSMEEETVIILNNQNILTQFMLILEKLYRDGVRINWNLFHNSYFSELPILPNYQFTKKVLWRELNFSQSDSNATHTTLLEQTDNNIKSKYSVHDIKDTVLDIAAHILGIEKEHLCDEHTLWC